MIVIDNTLHLEEIWISENLVDELESKTEIEIVGESFPLEFDSQGRMLL
jgi:hypothetical protein